jgi:hypothetical protein
MRLQADWDLHQAMQRGARRADACFAFADRDD